MQRGNAIFPLRNISTVDHQRNIESLFPFSFNPFVTSNLYDVLKIYDKRIVYKNVQNSYFYVEIEKEDKGKTIRKMAKKEYVNFTKIFNRNIFLSDGFFLKRSFERNQFAVLKRLRLYNRVDRDLQSRNLKFRVSRDSRRLLRANKTCRDFADPA